MGYLANGCKCRRQWLSNYNEEMSCTRSNFLGDVPYMITEVNMNQKRSVPLLLWPFWAIWRLIALVLELTGRLVGMILGIVLMIAGVLVSLTVVGAIIGIPLAIVGLMLTVRSIF